MRDAERYLQIGAGLREALDAGQPVVALESTVIAHGLPYPDNLETARQLEDVVRAQGATPATIAVIGGKIRIGLAEGELERLARGRDVRKVTRRDLPLVVARGEDGATTVAATMHIASLVGIEVFATGGIGGVHRGHPFDVSADLPELARTPMAVVCAGAKAILDLPLTMEWLETHGVPVVGYGTDEFPAFYSRHSGLPVDTRVDGPDEVACVIRTAWALGLDSGVLVAVPVPAGDELPAEAADGAIRLALAAAEKQGVRGQALTPFLLAEVSRLTGGASQRANLALLRNNAAVAAHIARALTEDSIPRNEKRPN